MYKACSTVIGNYGFGRVDYRIDYNNNIYVTDIATNPHITKGMSFYYAFSENGLNYTQMLETLISLGLIKSGHTLRESFGYEKLGFLQLIYSQLMDHNMII